MLSERRLPVSLAFLVTGFALGLPATAAAKEGRCQTIAHRQQRPFAWSMAVPMPRPSGSLTVQSADGYPFVVHGPAGTSALLTKIRDAADDAWRTEIDEGGWMAPLPDAGGGDSKFDIYVDGSLGEDEAYVEWEDEYDATSEDDATSFMVLPEDFSSDNAIVSTVAHELNHASQFAIDATEDDAFFEHTAVVVEQHAAHIPAVYGIGISDFQSHLARAIDYIDDSTYFEYGAGLWLMFLSEHVGDGGDALLQQLWMDNRQSTNDWTNEPDFLDVLPTLLDEQGWEVAPFFATFAAWRYFTGSRDDGWHFADGALWGASSLAPVTALALGADTVTLSASLSPYGAELNVLTPATAISSATLARVSGNVAAALVPLDSDGTALAAPTLIDSATATAVAALPPGTAKLLVALTRVPSSYDPDDDNWTAASVSASVTAGGDVPAGIDPGDLIVTEIMNNPTGTESVREWFEIYNTTARAIDVNGLAVADAGTDSFTIASGAPLEIAAHAYLVLGRSAVLGSNGGVQVDYVYSGMTLTNTTDEVVLKSGAVEIDRVAYDSSSFPAVEGHAMSLSPAAMTQAQNDAGANWCPAATALSGGDFGTPGAANGDCSGPADTTPPTITHTPIAGGQPAGLSVTVTAAIADASGIDSASLYYRAGSGGSFTPLAMTLVSGHTYAADVPAGAVTVAGVEYYLEATDGAEAHNVARSPAGGASAPYAFSVAEEDGAGPAIAHNPVTGPREAGRALAIAATVTDASGVSQVLLHYRTGAGSFVAMVMSSGEMHEFSALIPAAAVTPPSISYYIEAIDASPASNVSLLPTAGSTTPFVVEIESSDLDPPLIEHTPITAAMVAEAVTVEAQVTDASGVAEVTLYYRQSGATDFSTAAMTGGASGYAGVIPAGWVTAEGVDYYLEAVDGSPAANWGQDPAGAPAIFHTFMPDETGGGEIPGCGCNSAAHAPWLLASLAFLFSMRRRHACRRPLSSE